MCVPVCGRNCTDFPAVSPRAYKMNTQPRANSHRDQLVSFIKKKTRCRLLPRPPGRPHRCSLQTQQPVVVVCERLLKPAVLHQHRVCQRSNPSSRWQRQISSNTSQDINFVQNFFSKFTRDCSSFPHLAPFEIICGYYVAG